MTHLPLTDRPPRLILRFAVVTALCLGLGGSAIIVFTRHLNTLQAERTAAKHAQFLGQELLPDKLLASDFARPVSPTRRARLDQIFVKRVLLPGTLLVTLSRPDRVITYSTDHNLIGRRAASASRTQQALAGTVTSEVTSIPDSKGRSLKVLRSYVPLTLGRSKGVVAIYQDYGPIEKSARAALLPVAGILEIVMVLLFALLLPLLVRVTKRLSRYAERIQHQAFHDELTALPNRLHFRSRIARELETAQRDGFSVSVLLLDLDRFKEINETLGHPSGDELLQACAVRLLQATPAGAMLARLGGDEFGLVVARMPAGEAAALAEDIRQALQEPFPVRDIPLVIEASFGISTYPDNGLDVDAILQTADAAMYVAKDRRVGVFVYDGALESSTSDALQLVSQLRPALERKELFLHFQPQIAVATGAVTGAEALIRWQHPERGLLQPGAFVPFVERTGASTTLSAFVLEEAADQLRSWLGSGLDLGMAVNLTMFDLIDTNLPEQIADLLVRSELEPHRLELEITESLIMGDPQRVRDVVERLNAIGVRLAIDDFGTGYSSLTYLKSLPIDVIKIDRSFVLGMGANESDAAIVRSTIDLAHNLDLEVVAEGVEDEETLDELARHGCDFAQGYFISRPCDAAAFWPSVAAFTGRREAPAA